MDSEDFIQTLRNLLANDATLRTLMGVTTVSNALRAIVYSDAIFSQKVDFFAYPMIAVRLDEDESTLRGSDSNTPSVTIIIHNPAKNDGCVITLNKIKDRLKLLMKDKHEAFNSQAVLLGHTLKVRDCTWVGATTYDDKTLGSERLHKIICTCNFIVGD